MHNPQSSSLTEVFTAKSTLRLDNDAKIAPLTSNCCPLCQKQSINQIFCLQTATHLIHVGAWVSTEVVTWERYVNWWISEKRGGNTGGLKLGLPRTSWNSWGRGPRFTLFSCDVNSNNWMIVEGSRLNLNGNPGDVTWLCPAAWIGLVETSTLGISPSVRFWKVAVAATLSRLILAVNGLASVNNVVAIPVEAIFVGNVREALIIKVWWSPGIVTGDRCIWDKANCRDSMLVDPDVPAIVVAASMPWMKFCSKAWPAGRALPCGA